MSKSKGIREVGYVDVRGHAAAGRLQPVAWHDCAGGGQVVVERGLIYLLDRVRGLHILERI